MVALKNVTRALCTTPACLQLASYYTDNLSPVYKSLDPCVDFDEMVCGGWRSRHVIPPEGTQRTALSLVNDKNTELLRAVIEGGYPRDSAHSHFSPRNLHPGMASVDEENFNKMKLAYSACMDEDGLKKAGLAPIRNLVGRLRATFVGGDDWSAPTMFTHRLGTSTLIYAYVDSDFDDPERQLINLNSGPGLSLQRKDYYSNATMLENEYVPAMAGILQAVQQTNASSPAGNFNFTEQARQVVKLEADLAGIAPAQNLEFFKIASKLPLGAVDALAPELGLAKMAAALSPPGVPAGDVLLYQAYVGNLSKVLESTPREAIEGYFVWRAVLAVRTAVLTTDDDDVFKPFNNLRQRLSGVVGELATPPRWRTCLSFASNSLGWFLSRFFIETTFSARDRELSNQIVADVRSVYVANFGTLPWMDDATRQKAIEKVDRMAQKIGYPTDSPNVADPETLRDLYAGVEVTASHFDTSISISNDTMVKTWNKLAGPTDRENWGSYYPIIANARYRSEVNEVLFPAGILQPPVFFGGGDVPSAVNYGAFGAVAGHEVSHGFDRNGRNFDSAGRLVNWWSDGVLAEYNRRSQCFVDQFGNMTVYANDGGGGATTNKTRKGFKLDAQRTLGENQADSAGIVAAFASWQMRKTLNGKQKEPVLPGLEEWTDEQLFFLAYGNFWCGVISEEGLRLQIATDSHAPNAARTLGTTANSRAFREAFGCRVTEPTCSLW